MIRERFFFRETIATILADDPHHVAAAKAGILKSRQELERYIARDPFFQATFDPYEPGSDETIIRRMADAAKSASVGPMAAVAGAIAWAGVEAMAEAGAEFGVIDNGGDIALIATSRPVRVGIHAGSSPYSDKLAFIIPPERGIRGICTSSATVGPSISFGVADSVTVFSKNPALADAWATAICNRIRIDDSSVLSDIEREGITGTFIVIGEHTKSWGNLPPLVNAIVDEHLISAGDRL